MYSKHSIFYANAGIDRRVPNGDGVPTAGLNAAGITLAKTNYAKDLIIDDRITKFKAQLKNEYVYRIPLGYFTDLGKTNFPTKIDCRIKLFFETHMKKLFESRKLLATGAARQSPDVQVIFTKAPCILYEQILLDKNFRQYLEIIMVSKIILRMGTQKAPLQITYKINAG